MSLITEPEGAADEYDAVALPAAGDLAGGPVSAVFRRRSARPSRRAVLHLGDLSLSFTPPDMARWYNERGFHFYVTDLSGLESADAVPRRRGTRASRLSFGALDSACGYLREDDGIDAIILSAQGPAAGTAALWCDAEGAGRGVAALILSSPDFSGIGKASLEISCPVLVITAAGSPPGRPRGRRGKDALRLGQHVTWLHLDPSGPAGPDGERRRLFDEMGRWLGAYMYGKVRDQLL